MTTATERTPEQRAADPVSGVIIDDEGRLGEPAHDPIALGTALPLPVGVPAKILPVLLADDGPVVYGEPVPDLESLTGAQQNRVEVLTGKRLQKPEPEEVEPPVLLTVQERAERDREAREKREREKVEPPKATTKPVAKAPVVAPAKA